MCLERSWNGTMLEELCTQAEFTPAWNNVSTNLRAKTLEKMLPTQLLLS